MTATNRGFRSLRALLLVYAGCAAAYLVLRRVGTAWPVEVRGPLLLPEMRHEMWLAPHPAAEIGYRLVLPAIALAVTALWAVMRVTAAARIEPYASRVGALAGAVVGGALGGMVLYLSATLGDGSADSMRPWLARRIVEDAGTLSIVLGKPLWLLGPNAYALLGPVVDWVLLGTGLGLLADIARGRRASRSA